jgi:hypothetical protein
MKSTDCKVSKCFYHGAPVLSLNISVERGQTNFCYPYKYIYRKSNIYIYRLYIHISISIYSTVYININIYAAVTNKKMENGSVGDFLSSVYHLLIMQMEVCRMSVCLQRNKRKLSICKWTKQTKQTCPSMLSCTYFADPHLYTGVIVIRPLQNKS